MFIGGKDDKLWAILSNIRLIDGILITGVSIEDDWTDFKEEEDFDKDGNKERDAWDDFEEWEDFKKDYKNSD